jgi:sulfate permease, SulP family
MIQKIKCFLLDDNSKINIEFFSGITVAIALIPEAVAFSLVAHVNPLIGLYSAFFTGVTQTS